MNICVKSSGSFLISVVIIGCFPKVQPYIGNDAFMSPDGKPDYQQLNYWAAHPDKWDPSDSLRKDQTGIHTEKDADVFFLYPTSFTDDQGKYGDNAKIDDPYLNKKTDYTSMLYQASIFQSSCRVFAPRYRQAHISMYYSTDSIAKKKAFDLAYTDIEEAFKEFIKIRGKERPFILASHSQGTTHAYRLLKEEIMGGPMEKKLVAAYLIGMPVPKSGLDMPVCADSNSIGCIISWRTYANEYQSDGLDKNDRSTVVVNPVTWTTDTLRSTKTQHKGAVLYNYQKTYRHALTAGIMGDALYISKPSFPGPIFLNMQNYHAGDFNLFYKDIEMDAKRRIKRYNQQLNENKESVGTR